MIALFHALVVASYVVAGGALVACWLIVWIDGMPRRRP